MSWLHACSSLWRFFFIKSYNYNRVKHNNNTSFLHMKVECFGRKLSIRCAFWMKLALIEMYNTIKCNSIITTIIKYTRKTKNAENYYLTHQFCKFLAFLFHFSRRFFPRTLHLDKRLNFIHFDGFCRFPF